MPSLSAGQSGLPPLRPHRTTDLPQIEGEKPYILHLSPLPSSSGYIFSTSAPSLGLTHVDPELRIVGRVDYEAAKRGRVTQLKVADVGGGAVMASFAEGASLGLWDLRISSKQPSVELHGPNRTPMLSFDIASDGWTVAAGAELASHEAILDLWDLRKPSTYATRYAEAHSDDITAVAFSPNSLPLPSPSGSASPAPLLLSSSSSGLLALHNPLLSDEDDALLHASDVGASVASVGFMGSPTPTGSDSVEGLVWARTDMDTLSSWEVDGLGKAADWGSAKDHDVSRPDASWTEPIDYVIGCEWLPSLNDGRGSLAYFGGSQSGDVALISLEDPRPRTVLASLRSGHTDIVRCAAIDVASQTVVTGGEDGRLCLWNLSPPSSSSSSSASGPMASMGVGGATGIKGGASRAGDTPKTSRYKPY